MGVRHGLKVIYLILSKIMAKKAILAARCSQFGHFGILRR